MAFDRRLNSDWPTSEAIRPNLLGKIAFVATRRPWGRVKSESSAYETLLEQCWDSLWRYSYHMTGNRDDAGDLLSETIIEGFKCFAQFRGDTTFLRWMYRVMTTTRIDLLRRTKRHQAQSLDALREDGGRFAFEIPDEASNPETILAGDLLSEPVENALKSLSEEFRSVVVLTDIERLEYEEVSQILQIPVGTVRSRLHRARAQLRSRLTDYVDDQW